MDVITRQEYVKNLRAAHDEARSAELKILRASHGETAPHELDRHLGHLACVHGGAAVRLATMLLDLTHSVAERKSILASVKIEANNARTHGCALWDELRDAAHAPVDLGHTLDDAAQESPAQRIRRELREDSTGTLRRKLADAARDRRIQARNLLEQEQRDIREQEARIAALRRFSQGTEDHQ